MSIVDGVHRNTYTYRVSIQNAWRRLFCVDVGRMKKNERNSLKKQLLDKQLKIGYLELSSILNRSSTSVES